MADSFNQQMVTKLQQALLASPLGDTVTVDGTSVKYADAVQRLRIFEARLARERGRRRRVTGANLRAGVL